MIMIVILLENEKFDLMIDIGDIDVWRLVTL